MGKGKLRILFVSLATGFVGALGLPLAAHAATINGCSFTQTPTVWTLDANCTSFAEINITVGITLDGAGHTISSPFGWTSNSNNSSIGVLGNNATIQNLTIDGTGGPTGWHVGLHGINVYSSVNINIHDVTVRNMGNTGIVVNSSAVTVSDVTTSGNRWNGINVDKVVAPATLSIVGHMTQSDTAQIYVDDITKPVVVNDLLNQYIISHPGVQTNDRLYTLDTTATAMPTHLLPANNSTVNVHNFMFTWTTVTDPSSPVTYDWEGSYSSATTGAGGAFTGPKSATHTGLTSPEVNSPATPDNVYYWHVRAVDSAGNKSAWTDPWKVTVDTSLPPANKDQCKNNGWKSFTNPKFKNQGDCVSYVASDNKANGNPTVL